VPVYVFKGGKIARNTLKCGIQQSDPAVVGRKSGAPESANDDNCTKARFPLTEKRAFSGAD
jgi:hypothetical protein